MTFTQKKSATVHRFHGTVALYFPGVGMVYLREELARTLCTALQRTAKEVRDVPNFSESTIGTTYLGPKS